MLLTKLGELLIELPIFDGPDLSVLGFEDVVLGIVDDVIRGEGGLDEQSSQPHAETRAEENLGSFHLYTTDFIEQR